MYKVSLTSSSEKQLIRLPDFAYLKIRRIINLLKETPFPAGCKKLNNLEGYRIRMGKYRILYNVNNSSKSIIVYKIGHRKDVYR